MQKAIRISPADNTATLLGEAKAGETAEYRAGECLENCAVMQDTPFGHKIALCDISQGSPVIKYGEVIGTASADIRKGEHVHTHNTVSLRGRGDLKSENGSCSASEPVTRRVPVKVSPLKNISGRTFQGYPRKDGSAGTRNYVAVVSCVVCANETVTRLSEEPGAAGFTHQQGCSQTMPDVQRVKQVLVNLALNPNAGAVLYVSLGCESVPSEEVCREAAELSGKPVAMLCLQKDGGFTETVEKGKKLIAELRAASAQEPEAVPVSKLRLGLKCGSSDTTQGLSANLIAGHITDMMTAAGATVIMGETTEFMGAEQIAAARSADDETARRIVGCVAAMEKRAAAMGVDMRGGQPTRGNIAGGLTTIEEKSLGALVKSGTSTFMQAVSYGERPSSEGLVFMDSPGREPEMLTGLASAGCNLILFTTGRGAPQGFPFVPVVKVTGNSRTNSVMAEHMDLCVSGVMDGSLSPEEASGQLIEDLLEFASGRKTKAEVCAYNNSMNIYVTGPVI